MYKRQSIPEVEWAKVTKPEIEFFTHEETERILEAVDEEWLPMILLAVRTGMRRGELLGLDWEDVDLEQRKIHVRKSFSGGHLTTPKGGRARAIPLSPQVISTLSKVKIGSGPVFRDEEGNRLSKGKLRWPLFRACDRAGLARSRWHKLRHSFASQLVMRNVPLKVVQELMGHTTIEMTMRYTHLSPGVTSDAVALLDSENVAT